MLSPSVQPQTEINDVAWPRIGESHAEWTIIGGSCAQRRACGNMPHVSPWQSVPSLQGLLGLISKKFWRRYHRWTQSYGDWQTKWLFRNVYVLKLGLSHQLLQIQSSMFVMTCRRGTKGTKRKKTPDALMWQISWEEPFGGGARSAHGLPGSSRGISYGHLPPAAFKGHGMDTRFSC